MTVSSQPQQHIQRYMDGFQTKQLSDLQWLLRYAKHSQCQCLDDGFNSIRFMFSRPAWRLLCRSSRRDFLPLLRNQDLLFDDLVEYCERLVIFGFQSAPAPKLLSFLLAQLRLYFDRPCRIPEEQDYLLMRIAAREPVVNLRDMAKIVNWVAETRPEVRTCHRWSGLRKRAQRHHQLQRARHWWGERQWAFHLPSAVIDDFEFVALRTPADLWEEGDAMGSCVFQLRSCCDATYPSRFFSIRKASKRVGTLELALLSTDDRKRASWLMQDLRRSYNRLPSAQLTALALKFTAAYDQADALYGTAGEDLPACAAFP